MSRVFAIATVTVAAAMVVTGCGDGRSRPTVSGAPAQTSPGSSPVSPGGIPSSPPGLVIASDQPGKPLRLDFVDPDPSIGLRGHREYPDTAQGRPELPGTSNCRPDPATRGTLCLRGGRLHTSRSGGAETPFGQGVPEGKLIGVAKNGAALVAARGAVHLVERSSGRVRRLTPDSGHTPSSAAVSPDGAAVAFIATRGKETGLFLVPTMGGVPPQRVSAYTPPPGSMLLQWT